MSDIDTLADFKVEAFPAAGMSFPVYVSANAGPPVVVMHEMPNLTPQVAAFARSLVAGGFKVFMPSFLANAGHPSSGGIGVAISICIRKEFRGFAGNSTRPVVQWIRALARHASGPQHSKVGIIGMCFSGGFALGAATDPAIAAAVACQPGLPLAASIPFVGGVTGAKHDIDVDDADLASLKTRMEAGDLAVESYRFEGDAISPCERRLALGKALGSKLDARCIKDKFANPAVRSPAHHSVVTLHLLDEVGQPTREAKDRILAFLEWRLREGPTPPAPTPKLRDCAALGCARGH